MALDENSKKEVEEIVKTLLTRTNEFQSRKVGDTPTDNNQLVPKKYADTKISSSIIGAKGDLIVGTGASVMTRLPVGTDGFVLTADSAQTTGIKWASVASGNTDLFGDGIDGAASITGVTTLTSDKFYSALTVAATASVRTASYRLYCSGSLVVDVGGVISNNGVTGGAGTGGSGRTAGSGGSGGAATPTGSLPGGVSGDSGGNGGAGGTSGGSGGANGSNGTVGRNAAPAWGSVAGNGTGKGGNGGDASISNVGGTGGNAANGGTVTAAKNIPHTPLAVYNPYDFTPTSVVAILTSASSGGGGGGGGGGADANAEGGGGGGGGASGSPGGHLVIFGRVIVNNGVIQSKGGQGGAGGNGGDGSSSLGAKGGGGGGGQGGNGGTGGVVIIVTNSYTGNAPDVSGGERGANGSGGAGINGGAAGLAPTNAATGGYGASYILTI